MRGICFSIFIGLLSFMLANTSALAAPAVNVATAPDARSVAIGTAATIFAEFVNSGDMAATNCSIAKPAGVPIDLAYQTLDAGGGLSGTADTPANVGANASQRFLVTFTPTAAFEGRVHLRYSCDNFTPFVFEDVNDLFLTASVGDPPDLIAIFATPSGDGVMRVATNAGIQAAGGAVVNIGSAGGEAVVDVTPTFGDFDEGPGVALSICETDPANGACMAPPSPFVQMSVGAAAKTFSVFAIAPTGIGVALFPEYIRVSVVFSDPAAAPETPEGNGKVGLAAIAGTIRGRGSVAFTSPAVADVAMLLPTPFTGRYILRNRDLINDPNSDFISLGELVIDAQGQASGLYHRFSVVDGQGNFVGEADQVFTLEGVFDPAALTFAGQMVFVPDVFLNTPPLRGNFVANFDPGRSMRGTYSFTAAADAPQKGQTSAPSKPQTIPTSSPNIQMTGTTSVRDFACSIFKSIPVAGKTFDIYIRGVKVGSVVLKLGAFKEDFDITGSASVSIDGGEDQQISINGTIDAEGISDSILGGVFADTSLTRADGSRLFSGRGIVTRCTKNGFTIGTVDKGSNPDSTADDTSLVLEFRMSMPG